MTLAQAAVWNGPAGSQPSSWNSASPTSASAPEASNPWTKTATVAPSFWGDVVKAPNGGPTAASKVGNAAAKASAQPKGPSPPKQVCLQGEEEEEENMVRVGSDV